MTIVAIRNLDEMLIQKNRKPQRNRISIRHTFSCILFAFSITIRLINGMPALWPSFMTYDD